MSGYHNFSKSNRAIAAEKSGLMTSSKLAKFLKKGYVAADVSKVLTASEWHHTSKMYNATNYYDATDLLFLHNRIALRKAKALREKSKNEVAEFDGEVVYRVFGGTRNHVTCREEIFEGKVFFDGKWLKFNGLKKNASGGHIGFHLDNGNGVVFKKRLPEKYDLTKPSIKKFINGERLF